MRDIHDNNMPNRTLLKEKQRLFMVGSILIISCSLISVIGRLILWKCDYAFDATPNLFFLEPHSLWKYVLVPVIFMAIECILGVLLLLLRNTKGKWPIYILLILALIVILISANNIFSSDLHRSYEPKIDKDLFFPLFLFFTLVCNAVIFLGIILTWASFVQSVRFNRNSIPN